MWINKKNDMILMQFCVINNKFLYLALETPSQMPSNITLGDRTQGRSTTLSSQLGWTLTPTSSSSSKLNGSGPQRTSTSLSKFMLGFIVDYCSCLFNRLYNNVTAECFYIKILLIY